MARSDMAIIKVLMEIRQGRSLTPQGVKFNRNPVRETMITLKARLKSNRSIRPRSSFPGKKAQITV
jgi:hypothetical protein